MSQRPSDPAPVTPPGGDGRSPPPPPPRSRRHRTVPDDGPGPAADRSGPRMPGTVRTARLLLVLHGLLTAVGAVVLIAIAVTAEDRAAVEAVGGYSPAGFYLLLAAATAAFSAAQFTVAARFPRGGNGTRVLGAVLGALLALVAAVDLLTGSAVALVHLAVGVLILGLTCTGPAIEWFDRAPG